MSEIADELRKHKIPVTAQRLAVMHAVTKNPHATADEIIKQARDELGAISRQAGYNVLGFLSERGFLRKIQPAGSAARYEARVEDNHHHLVCRECGATVDVDCAVGEAPCLVAKDNLGYLIDEAEVIFWGVCPDCQKADQ